MYIVNPTRTGGWAKSWSISHARMSRGVLGDDEEEEVTEEKGGE
jgi:hypothetical protein